MRAAVLGIAHMHAYSYVDSLRLLNVEIIGAVEKDLEAGRKFAELKQMKFYDNLNDLLSEKPDFVLICSDNATHKEYTLAAARAGIHVIVEKPIATKSEDALEMIKVCADNNVKLMLCFPVRYATPIKQVKKALDNGEIGEIRSIVATNHGSMPGGWFIDEERSGGGCVIDHTVHVCDIMNWVMRSDIKEVSAIMDTLIHPIDVEDCGLLMLEFENGVIASIDTSWNRPKSNPNWGDVVMDFNGTSGSVRADAFLERGMVYGDNNNKSVFYSFGNDMDYEMLKDFINAIENDLPAPVTGEDGLFALRVAEMAYEFSKKDK